MHKRFFVATCKEISRVAIAGFRVDDSLKKVRLPVTDGRLQASWPALVQRARLRSVHARDTTAQELPFWSDIDADAQCR